MKCKFMRYALGGMLLSVLPALCSATGVEEVKPWDRLPMSMYIWRTALMDSAEIERIDFDNYDIVYLMDGAFWKSPEHFRTNADSVARTPGAIIPLSMPERYRQAVRLAHDNGTIAMLTGGDDLMYGAMDDDLTETLVGALVRTVDEIGFDGIDVDWEGGVHANLPRHTHLLSRLRHGLDSLGERNKRKYYVSTALSTGTKYPDSLRAKFSEAVDHINLMSYDMGGGVWSNKATHNSPLDVIARRFDENWYDIPREKLHLGLASYGFIYTGLQPGEVVPAGKSTSHYGKYTNYNNELPKLYGSHKWKRVYEEGPAMYYFIAPDSSAFLTMELPETVVKKFELAAKAGLGGTFWWEFGKDIVDDKNGSNKWQHILVPDHKQTGRYKTKK